MIEISIASEVSEDLVAAFQLLVPQLSSSNPPPSAEMLRQIVDSEASTLLIASDETGIIGTLTLAIVHIPTGTRAWIEDVVVDSASRGKGVGRLLNEAALDHARSAGAATVDLTSRPSRAAANRLYRRIGFELRSTNVYRCTL